MSGISSDILWYNSATGNTQIWVMDGHKIASRPTVVGEDGNPILIGPPWSIVGTGMFTRLHVYGAIRDKYTQLGESRSWLVLVSGAKVASQSTFQEGNG